MKKRKAIAAVGIILCMGMMMAGCATTVDDSQTEVGKMSMEDGKIANPLENMEDEEQEDNQVEDAGKGEHNDEEADVAGQGTEYLGGKVQSPQADGMILAKTTIMDEDGAITMLDEKDAKKIPVKFTQETKAEHWIIQGGGSDIDMKEAVLSDLEEGMLVELEGYFEGDNFVATKVIIEEYV
ncbi:MAG: hypothetical protein HDR01_12205 [Lachnospiraceae bacterium]|nr:hypothetical protein [Lachnospiraceae bacterium]